MPLNLKDPTAFTPNIKWMANEKRWVISRAESSDTDPVVWEECVFDLRNIKTGWGAISAGVQPEWVWDQSIDSMASMPTDGKEWKRGFSVTMFSPKFFGGDGIREWSQNGAGTSKGMSALFDQYESMIQQTPDHTALVPVVKFTGSEPSFQTAIPTLVIDRWVNRPPILDTVAAVAVQPVIGTSPSGTIPTAPQPVAPPQPQPAAVPVQPPSIMPDTPQPATPASTPEF
jgi:hypothetical protein